MNAIVFRLADTPPTHLWAGGSARSAGAYALGPSQPGRWRLWTRSGSAGTPGPAPGRPGSTSSGGSGRNGDTAWCPPRPRGCWGSGWPTSAGLGRGETFRKT
eukprot:scaffold364894_cov47-Prasinocladus_malaysianus.AAC.1